MYSVVCNRNVKESTKKIIGTSKFKSIRNTKSTRLTMSNNQTVRNRNQATTSGSGGNTPIVNGTNYSPSSSDRSTSTNKTRRI